MFRILLFFFVMSLSMNAFASSYKVNHAEMDALFDTAQKQNLQNKSCLFGSNFLPSEDDDLIKISEEKSAIPAFILSFFLGPTGLHRAYLGTRTSVVLGYIITCGGCTILWGIDTVLLLVGILREDTQKYMDNPKFFMW